MNLSQLPPITTTHVASLIGLAGLAGVTFVAWLLGRWTARVERDLYGDDLAP